MVKAAVGAVDISGGEPLLHPRFPEFLRSVLRHAKRVSVLTNGILVHKYIDVISSYSGRVSVQVSIDPLDGSVYAEAKGVEPGVLDRVLSSVKELLRRGVRVSIAVPVSKINIGTLGSTVEGLKRMFGDAAGIRVSPVLSIGGADPAYAFTPEEYGELAAKLSRYAQKLPEEVNDELRGAALLLGNCGAGWKRAVITADGCVYPCPCSPREERWLLGRIDEEPSRVLGFRVSRLLARLPRPGGSVCEHCQYEGWCMGCMARAIELWERGVPCRWARRHLEPLAPTATLRRSLVRRYYVELSKAQVLGRYRVLGPRELARARAYLLVEPGCAEQLYGVAAAHGAASHVFHGGVAAASLLLDNSVQRELAGRLGGCIVEAGLRLRSLYSAFPYELYDPLEGRWRLEPVPRFMERLARAGLLERRKNAAGG